MEYYAHNFTPLNQKHCSSVTVTNEMHQFVNYIFTTPYKWRNNSLHSVKGLIFTLLLHDCKLIKEHANLLSVLV